MEHLVKLKKLRDHLVFFPGHKSCLAFDVVLEVGRHECEGVPLTLKRLLLLNIASPSSVRRLVTQLVKDGVVIRRAHPSDHRLVHFVLSEQAHGVLRHCLQATVSVLDQVSKEGSKA